MDLPDLIVFLIIGLALVLGVVVAVGHGGIWRG
jgi:hypothetical protein